MWRKCVICNKGFFENPTGIKVTFTSRVFTQALVTPTHFIYIPSLNFFQQMELSQRCFKL